MSTPAPTNPTPGGTAAGNGSTSSPFACDNCGHKPDAQEVIDHYGDCSKCGDTVKAFTVDAAEYILRSQAALRSAADKALAAWDGWQGSLNKKPQNLDALLDAIADLRSALKGKLSQ